MAKMMLNLAILLTLLTVATSETTEHFVCRRARNARYGGFAVETVDHTRSAQGPPGERGAPGVPGGQGAPGNPGSVDYEHISRIITEEIREGLERLNSKIDMLQSNTSELAAGLEEVKTKVDTLQNKFRERLEANPIRPEEANSTVGPIQYNSTDLVEPRNRWTTANPRRLEEMNSTVDTLQNNSTEPVEVIHRIRLVGGSSSSNGRVEVFYGGEWGTVCDDLWDIKDANVVCRMLGYNNASSAPHQARYGHGSGRIWLDNVNCSGSELTLWDCGKDTWGRHNCGHNEDASVVCGLEEVNSTVGPLQNNSTEPVEPRNQWTTVDPRRLEEMNSTVDTLQSNSTEQVESGSIRLVGGSSATEGRVEVFYNGEWGTVCDDNWGISDANVVCRMLGYIAASSAPPQARYGRGSGRIWLDEVDCRGTESTLWDCRKGQWGSHDCSHAEDASVVCGRQGWYQASNGYFYKYFATTKTYNEASTDCQSFNARIIMEGVRNVSLQRRLFDDVGATGQVWIGATDSAREGRWMWNDGNPVRESDITWNDDEPNDANSGEDCAEYNKDGDGWVANDVPCTARRSSICEAAN